MPPSHPRYFNRPDTGHKAAVIGTTVAILSASVVVMLVAGVATAPLMSDLSFQTEAHARLVVLAVLGAAFTILTIPFRQDFQFEQRVRVYVALSTCSALVTAAVTVWAVVGLGRGILGFIEATLIGQAFTFAIFLTIASRRVSLSVDWAIGRDLLRLGLPMIPAFGSIFFMQHGSKYLLQRLGSLDDVGIYTIGLNVGLVISVLVTGFQSAWVPYFMSFADRQDEARIQLGRVATYYVFSFGAVSLVLFAVARLVVLLMTQPEFHPAWRVVGLSAAAQFLSGFFIVLLPGMYYAREVKYIALIQGAAALIGLLIGVGMILSFGVFGAALGLTLSYVGLVVLQYRLQSPAALCRCEVRMAATPAVCADLRGVCVCDAGGPWVIAGRGEHHGVRGHRLRAPHHCTADDARRTAVPAISCEAAVRTVHRSRCAACEGSGSP